MRIPALISSVSLWGRMLPLAGGAVAQTFTAFDPPNSINTRPLSINGAGEITGRFIDTTTGTVRGVCARQGGRHHRLRSP